MSSTSCHIPCDILLHVEKQGVCWIVLVSLSILLISETHPSGARVQELRADLSDRIRATESVGGSSSVPKTSSWFGLITL